MKIGIVGGGQLGMMMAEQAIILGHQVISLDPNPNCSITKYSNLHIAKDYNDPSALEEMNQRCDVITYEFENVNLEVLNNYIKKLPQKTEALRLSRDRIIEKEYAQSLGIATPHFNKVISKNDIIIPSIVKTTTGGYDGKGQYKITNESEIDQIDNIVENKYICEELIDFDYEISVVATRDSYNTIAYYPVPINIHKNGILHVSIASNEIDTEITNQAKRYTKALLEDLDYIGTLAVEYFVVKDKVLFNEFAPRPHNSGHYTMNGCNVSQFHNHILAITNEKVIKPILKQNTVMINVLGQNKAFYDIAGNIDNCFIHDYYKNSKQTNRKIGHINYLYHTQEELTQFIHRITKEN